MSQSRELRTGQKGKKNPDVLIEKRHMPCFPTVNLGELSTMSSKTVIWTRNNNRK